MALVRAITALRESSQLTNQELVERADMSASYYYARLRGDAPFDTNDIEKLAVALGVRPHEISRAAALLEDEEIEPRVDVDISELSRRLNLLQGPPRLDGSVFDETALIEALAEGGVTLQADEWRQLVSGQHQGAVRSSVLIGVAEYAGVTQEYLLDLDDSEAAESAEAQLDFRLALSESGADSVAARALGDVSPAALRAIAQSVRSIHPRA